MVRSLTMSCVKNIVFAFNFILVICGIALITIGGLMLKVLSDHGQVITTKSYVGVPAVIMIIIGGSIFILAFLACCGAITESASMLNLYSALLFLILIAEIVLACAVGFYKSEAQRQFQNMLEAAFNQYESHDDSMRKAWDFLQIKLQCCGLLKGQSDFDNKGGIPASCCGRTSGGCDRGHAYVKPCVTAIEDFIKGNVVAVGVSAGVIALVEMVLIMFSCCLASAIRNRT